MAEEEITTPISLEDMPLTHVVRYLDSGEVYLFALTCSTSLAAVQAVHKGVVPARSLRCFFPPGGALFNYACDSLMWEGESMQRDGVYWLVCAASRGSVDKGGRGYALRACGGSQLPCAWDERLCVSLWCRRASWSCSSGCAHRSLRARATFGRVWSWQRRAGQCGPTSRWGWTSWTCAIIEPKT